MQLKHVVTGESIPVDAMMFTVRDDKTDAPLFQASVMRDTREYDRLLRRLELHLERMPVALITVGASGEVKGWNPAAERLFGDACRRRSRTTGARGAACPSAGRDRRVRSRLGGGAYGDDRLRPTGHGGVVSGDPRRGRRGSRGDHADRPRYDRAAACRAGAQGGPAGRSDGHVECRLGRSRDGVVGRAVRSGRRRPADVRAHRTVVLGTAGPGRAGAGTAVTPPDDFEPPVQIQLSDCETGRRDGPVSGGRRPPQ